MNRKVQLELEVNLNNTCRASVVSKCTGLALCHVIGNSRSLACLGLVLEPSSFPTTSSPLPPHSLLQMSKKGAKNTKEVRQYSIGDVVLGKVRGYPPWPAMVSAKSR